MRDASDSPSLFDRLPHRADQLAIAVLVLCGLISTVAWWVAQGGLRGELVEFDQASPRTAVFLVDVNAAQWPELAQIPGIGPTLAQRIVQSRQAAGPFKSHNDLRRVRGIGPATLQRMRPYLCPIDGPGTVAADR